MKYTTISDKNDITIIKLEDGTKIDSIANRILLFDSSKKHCSTTTTNTFARINININFILENGKERNEIIR